MGDSYQKIVDRIVTLEDAEAKVNLVKTWLVDKKIILPDISDCTLGDEGGCPPGPNYTYAAESSSEILFMLKDKGVSIESGPQWVLDPRAGRYDMICTDCNSRHQAKEECFEAIDTWMEEMQDVQIACPGCSRQKFMREWDFDPPIAIGCFAVTFWNWPPLKESFIKELENIIGNKVVYVSGKY
jgi:hypothetical protein